MRASSFWRPRIKRRLAPRVSGEVTSYPRGSREVTAYPQGSGEVTAYPRGSVEVTDLEIHSDSEPA